MVRSKTAAALAHFGISALASVAAAWVVLVIWFPEPYRELSGGHILTLLVAGINLIIGPLLTWILFNPNKKKKEIALDVLLVVTIQIATLFYGLHSAYLSRPIYLVHEVDRFVVVTAADVGVTLNAAPKELRHPTSGKVRVIGVREITNPQERMQSMELAIQGLDVSLRPKYWQEISQENKKILIQRSKPLRGLLQRHPFIKEEVDALAAENEIQLDDLVYLPVVGRKIIWSAVMNSHDLAILGFLKVDGF